MKNPERQRKTTGQQGSNKPNGVTTISLSLANYFAVALVAVTVDVFP